MCFVNDLGTASSALVVDKTHGDGIAMRSLATASCYFLNVYKWRSGQVYRKFLKEKRWHHSDKSVMTSSPGELVMKSDIHVTFS